MKQLESIPDALALLKQGKIIAYPTEAVYGLGCDPFNKQAVDRLLALKQRQVDKGLILLISSWEQLTELTLTIPESAMQKVKNTWPGPVTWIFPKSDRVPDWVSGNRPTIAIRMSAHPIAQALSVTGPVVSTSANQTGFEPAKSLGDLEAEFPQGVDACITGELGGRENPSTIFDALTGVQLR